MSTSSAVARETDSDLSLLERLHTGDQLALAELVERHHHSLLRLASVFLRNRASAEEVVQETWMAVLKATASFEGRSRIKTWIFRILSRPARTRLIRAHPSTPLAALTPS